MKRMSLTAGETEEAAGWVCRIGEAVGELACGDRASGDGIVTAPDIAMALDVLADDLDAILGGGTPADRRGTVEEDAQKLAAAIWVRVRVHLRPDQSLRPLYSAVRVMHDQALIRSCTVQSDVTRRVWPPSPGD
ncbi:hypothetical protein [Azospirillum sp.]|uniref:hypothetical protein n=1 Tax=Azospirillum sp. TaxID=34012 RepID=UPI002D55A621|nr:hypothetical protein [Azospirillum sp.]HYF89574.1 hypothetical protein [Azospirillum sp.]